MKSIFVGLFTAAFSVSALAQPTPQERAAADRAQCEQRPIVASSPNEVLEARERCVQDFAIQRHREVMEQCQKVASKMARPTIPAEAFYKDCMYQNGYRYE